MWGRYYAAGRDRGPSGGPTRMNASKAAKVGTTGETSNEERWWVGQLLAGHSSTILGGQMCRFRREGVRKG